MTKNSWFLDTSFSVALTIPKDEHHRVAVEFADEIQENSVSIITTQAVILEIGNALSKKKFRKTAASLIHHMSSDENVSIVSLTQELYDRGLELFGNRLDKNWSLVDCISFVVMAECEITDALTTDIHFKQAGFRALLGTINFT